MENSRVRKSIGREITLSRDMVDRIEVERVLWEIAEDIEKIMTRYQALASTVTLKVKFHDFQTVTRSFSPDYPIHRATEIVKFVDALVTKTEVGKKPLRLLGISLSGLSGGGFDEYDPQMELPFD